MNMLSKKALYGIRALIALDQAAPDSLSTGEIAAQGPLPRKFLEPILVSLKRAGMAVSQRGREGGYVLARPADQINLADVIRAMDGPDPLCLAHRLPALRRLPRRRGLPPPVCCVWGLGLGGIALLQGLTLLNALR